MIDRGHRLPLSRQGELLGISRGSLYYDPCPVSATDLAIMRRIDALHLDYPFAGSRMLRDLLRGEGIAIGRERVTTMMRRIGLEAIYRRPHTSKPADGHKVYPYLLRGVTIERVNQVWAMDITYIPMARGFVYLTAVVDWFSRRVSVGMEVDFCLDAVDEALARHGRPDIFNTDSKSDGVGSFSIISSYQAANCPRVAGTARCPSRPDPNTDRPGFVSFPGSVGWLSHQAVRFCLADAGDPRRA
jgi:putative transposase